MDHIIKIDSLFYGIDQRELGLMAYKFAEKNSIPHPFRNGNGFIIL